MNNETKGIEIAGHRVHQMFVFLPLGLLAGAALFDAIHIGTGNAQWASASYWMMAIGLVSAVVAAVFGFFDWRGIPRDTQAKGVGAAHGVGNLFVVALFATSWVLRGDTPTHPSGIALALSFVGVALAVVTAWLGGELVSRHGVGVGRNANVDSPGVFARNP